MSNSILESRNQYDYAYKQARKQFIKDKLNKRTPYLESLDEIVDTYEVSTIHLGIIDVPASLIVGTKTSLRKISFASNFMPLMNAGSEFSSKWIKVCSYHLSDQGINEPCVAYEYLGKFYIEEGNKRASVLKSFGAIYIPCDVIRVLPKDDGSDVYKLYKEFVEYYELSHLYGIQFEKLGYYKKLQRLMMFSDNHVWSRQERIKLVGFYERLKDMLIKKKIKTSYADSLMVMLEVYGYELLYEMSDKKLSNAVDESKNRILYDKAHANILCVADEEDQSLWGGYNSTQLKTYDFLISCGDLKKDYLEYLVTISNKPLFYVHGNHDESYEENPPEGCICIDDDVYMIDGIRIMGLGGSYKYRDGKYMYTEKQMEKRIKKLKRKIKKVGGIDIVVAHAPIKGYGDIDDYAHQGFECFKKLIYDYHPKYFVFGHVHSRYQHNYQTTYILEETQIINVSGKQRILY